MDVSASSSPRSSGTVLTTRSRPITVKCRVAASRRHVDALGLQRDHDFPLAPEPANPA
jgi:hypothetical protein